jgi:putative transposase
MPRKNYKPDEIVAKLRQADVLIAQGAKIPDVFRTIGVMQVTYYRCRCEFGGLQLDQRPRIFLD